MPSRRARQRRSTAGLTLVEAALLVCLVGVALAVFLPQFVRQLRTSKVSEAGRMLAVMHRATAAYYGTRHETDGRGRGLACIPEAAGPAPAAASVDLVEVDFSAEETPGAATWKALDFQPDDRVRYRYTFEPSVVGCGVHATSAEAAPVVTMRAEGDLDGDGKRSLFERQATVNEHGALVPKGILYTLDRVE